MSLFFAMAPAETCADMRNRERALYSLKKAAGLHEDAPLSGIGGV
jgi:hypothetical protein